jgi:hypothetical protein
MYRNEGLVTQAERFRNAANTHWLTSTLHRYYNCGSPKYKHLFPSERIEELEVGLQRFVSSKGVGRELTKQEKDEVFKKLGWKR